MTVCPEGCGRCCDPVPLAYTQEDVARQLPFQISGGKADRDFILNVLKPISRREGLARSWFTEGGKTTAVFSGNPFDSGEVRYTFFYECSWFDRETRQCTNYDNRPPMCRQYPWYDMQPDPTVALAPECAYNADVGRPVAVVIR